MPASSAFRDLSLGMNLHSPIKTSSRERILENFQCSLFTSHMVSLRYEQVKRVTHFFCQTQQKWKHMNIDFTQVTIGQMLCQLSVSRITDSQCSNYKIKPYSQLARTSSLMTNCVKMVTVAVFTSNHHRMPGNTVMLINPVHLANVVSIICNPKPLGTKIYFHAHTSSHYSSCFQMVIIYRLSQ